MECEVCGQRIVSKASKVIIEGAKLIACESCSQLGEEYPEVAPPRKSFGGRRAFKRKVRVETLPREVTDYEVAENYASRIRRAREKLKLSQEELANIVKERLSILHKIEAGRMIPDTRLAKALEHSLRIDLLLPRSEPPETRTRTNESSGRTLGDVVQFRGKRVDLDLNT